MKHSFIMGAAVAAVAMLSSCSYRMTKSSSNDMTPIVRPIMADLEVKKEKVSYTYVVEKKAILTTSEDAMLRNAVFNALNKVKADVIVGLQYQFQEQGSSRKTRERQVTITGYPAYYKNIRPVPGNEFNVKELKKDTPYIVTEKSGTGDTKVYTIITTTETEPVLNLSNTEVDQVVLRNQGGSKGLFSKKK